jgi:hypothetical protein
MKCPHCGEVYPNGRAIVIEHAGKTVSLRDLANMAGIAYQTLRHRWRRGDRGPELIRPADPKYSRRGLE